MKFLSQVNLKGKVVLLRADLNSDVVNGRVLNGERIKKSADTIKKLKVKKAKIVIIAHQGRRESKNTISLKQHSKFLSKYTKVKFIGDLFGKRAEEAITSLKAGEAILLENVRKYKEEYNLGKNIFVKNLSRWCDVYVNDAFSNSHRVHSSMVSFPKYLKSYAGPLFESEIKALKKIKLGKVLFILGGAKPKDNLKLLGKNKVLACGLFGQLCLIAKGFKFGKQEVYLKKEIKDFNSILRALKGKLKNVETPIDFAVRVSGKRKELPLKNFPSKYEIYDIGKKTQERYKLIIKNSKSVYMKGPAGFCGYKDFCKGTLALLKAISKSEGFSLLGGGHLSDAIKTSGISKSKFGHVSLSGGALAKYLSGEKLPGLESLK